MSLQDERVRLPPAPGVYLMKDRQGRVLYVGKAVNLRNRVRAYFRGQDDRSQIPALMARVHDVDYIVTEDERDALILESQLISLHQPPFNIDLRDDKTWLSIRLDLRETFPRLLAVRRWRNDGARYFGPYLLDNHARRVVGALRTALPLRSCSDGVLRSHRRLGRPCLEAQLDRCCAPCVGAVTEEEYKELVRQVVDVLDGRGQKVRKMLEARMWEAAKAEEFERAALLRNQMEALERAFVRSRVRGKRGRDVDAWGIARVGDESALAIVRIRDGQVLATKTVLLGGIVAHTQELLATMLMQLYGAGEQPEMIVLPQAPEASEVIEQHLGVTLRVPQRGELRRFVDLAMANAESRLQTEADTRAMNQRAHVRIAKLMQLDVAPRSIECIDNAHFHGEHGYSAVVRFVNGVADKGRYKLFRLSASVSGDDYGAMFETLSRRLKRSVEGDQQWSLPDLFVVDGGRGQLSVALSAARALGINGVKWCAIAKPTEGESTDKVYVPGRVNPLPLKEHDPALHLLQRVRDEAHRFSNRNHRKARHRATTRSVLSDVTGLGPERQRRLLRHFGSVRAIREATVDEIQQVQGIGPTLAQTVFENLTAYRPSGEDES